MITATVTPLNADGSVNHTLLADHCQSLISRGGNGIALLGTTGEANSFSSEERMAIVEQLIKSGFDPAMMIVGTGTCSLTETVSLTTHAVAAGAGGVLLMPEDSKEELKTLVSSLHTQGKLTIAPMVDTASLLPVLWQAGINYIQGYYIQQPSVQMDYDFSTEDDDDVSENISY